MSKIEYIWTLFNESHCSVLPPRDLRGSFRGQILWKTGLYAILSILITPNHSIRGIDLIFTTMTTNGLSWLSARWCDPVRKGEKSEKLLVAGHEDLRTRYQLYIQARNRLDK